MARNPILEELYASRDKLLADCKGDVHAYIQEARQRALAQVAREGPRLEREALADVAEHVVHDVHVRVHPLRRGGGGGGGAGVCGGEAAHPLQAIAFPDRRPQ